MGVKTGNGSVTLDRGGKSIPGLWTEETTNSPNVGDRHLRGQSAPVLGMSDVALVLEIDAKNEAGLDFARGVLRREGYSDKRGQLVLRSDGRFNFVG
jgi:hypothetical protein